MWFFVLTIVLALQGSCQAAYIKHTKEQVSRSTNASSSVNDQLASLAASALTTAKSLMAEDASGNNTCTEDNVQVRKEWGALSETERLDYISALQCLMTQPPRTPSSLAPGAKSRYDDFQVTHMNQMMSIHNTANFLSWHRYFVWLFEEALRTECGYKGASPYWDWTITAETGLETSPIFDGSPTSLSGNGDYVQRNGSIVLSAGPSIVPVEFPAGTGGGCVTTGPFANRNLTLGPVRLNDAGNVTLSNGDGLQDNPRCWRRDLNNYVNKAFGNSTSLLNTLVQPTNIVDFQLKLQGGKLGSGDLGVHGAGHYSIGGDPANDAYTSPGDPAFYLHHSMIDRVWWMWQMQSPEARLYAGDAIGGTVTFNNDPPSKEGTLDDLVHYGYASGPSRKIRELQSTTRGPFCYVYA